MNVIAAVMPQELVALTLLAFQQRKITLSINLKFELFKHVNEKTFFEQNFENGKELSSSKSKKVTIFTFSLNVINHKKTLVAHFP
jgi:hypothetical protein